MLQIRNFRNSFSVIFSPLETVSYPVSIVTCIDLQGADNTIPLSPQWLLPKPGENKAGVVAGVCYYLFHPFLHDT